MADRSRLARATGRPPWARLAPALLALVVVGCGVGPTPAPTASPAPTPTASATERPTGTPRPPTEVLLVEIRVAVSGIRGIEPSGDVEPVIIDEATLRANLESEFDAESPPAELAIVEDVYEVLGLLPTGASLRALSLDLLAGQVAGYYSPERDELFVVSRSGVVGPVELATYAHEFTHQLQDQRFDLDGLGLDATDQGDRALAVLALIEGDATAAQSGWLQSGALTPEELGEIFQASLDPAGLEALRRAPAILRETTLFPYRDGSAFVIDLLFQGGYQAVNAAYASPPQSTEQVLHPEKYAAAEAPRDVSVPASLARHLGDDWTEAARDTLGELVLRIWLREGGLEAADSRAAAAGWGGDRLVLLRGPGGQLAVALLSEWDSPADAADFGAAASSAIASLGLAGTVLQSPGSAWVALAIGDRSVDLAAALRASAPE
jgi:hypothetical protein